MNEDIYKIDNAGPNSYIKLPGYAFFLEKSTHTHSIYILIWWKWKNKVSVHEIMYENDMTKSKCCHRNIYYKFSPSKNKFSDLMNRPNYLLYLAHYMCRNNIHIISSSLSYLKCIEILCLWRNFTSGQNNHYNRQYELYFICRHNYIWMDFDIIEEVFIFGYWKTYF